MKQKKRQWTHREFTKVLNENGYSLKRYTGSSHQIFSNGKSSISVPYTKLNAMVINRLIKENGIET